VKITLCGSERFQGEMQAINERLTLAGHIVYMPCVIARELTPDEKQVLSLNMYAKIEDSDALVVVDCMSDGTPTQNALEARGDDTTRGMMRWAAVRGKKIFYRSEAGRLTNLVFEGVKMSRADFSHGYSETTLKSDWDSY